MSAIESIFIDFEVETNNSQEIQMLKCLLKNLTSNRKGEVAKRDINRNGTDEDYIVDQI